MIRFCCASALLLLSLGATGSASAQSVAPTELIKAAKSAPLSEIDDRRKSCNDDRTVEEWLKEAISKEARSIAWTAGACKLANRNNPRDAGTKWCAQAAIAPKKGGPPVTVEIYFEAPKGGRSGKAFAFRGSIRMKAGWDTMRDTVAFENNWGETYVADYKPDDGCG